MEMKFVLYDLKRISIIVGSLAKNIEDLKPEEYTVAGRKLMMKNIDVLRNRLMKLPIPPPSEKKVK